MRRFQTGNSTTIHHGKLGTSAAVPLGPATTRQSRQYSLRSVSSRMRCGLWGGVGPWTGVAVDRDIDPPKMLTLKFVPKGHLSDATLIRERATS